MTRQTGIVKWFSDTKGFGFITMDDNKGDVFVHHSNIQMQGFRTLTEGQKVSFVLQESPKGLTAIDVDKI